MKLLIDISEYNAEYIKNAYEIPQDINMIIAEAIINGKQIPTPHGRLGDLDKLEKQFKRAIGTYLPKDPTRHMSIVDGSECRGWAQALTAVQEAKTVIEAEE
jgi:hypothetical protein